MTNEILENSLYKKNPMAANAFAALLLVPIAALNEQIGAYGLDRKNLSQDAIVRLVDIFAVPFKAK